MEQLPLPAPIHYELILQLLEKQSMNAVSQNSDLRHQVSQLIITMRKAAAQQKRLEEICQASSVAVDHRWSLNHHGGKVITPD
jgi:23S rRNA G2069 N7-methylase RlmK/C1962 C5-methylase RlmI